MSESITLPGARMAPMSPSSMARIATLAAKSLSPIPFSGRGLSHRTVEALLAANIDVPERLLFMTIEDIAGFKGIGSKSLAEITNYRARFVR